MSLPRYIKLCLDKIRKTEYNESFIHSIKRFYGGEDNIFYGKEAPPNRMYGLNTIYVKIFCNFCRHTDRATISEMIIYARSNSQN